MLCKRYLDIVESLKTQTGGSAIKSHLFRLLKPYLDSLPDEKMREKIGLARSVSEYRAIIGELEEMMKVRDICLKNDTYHQQKEWVRGKKTKRKRS